MAKKAELLEKAQELQLDVTEKNTIAEIEAAIKAADTTEVVTEEVVVVEDADKNEAVVIDEVTVEEESFAKSGKRSKKAAEEAEENAEKEARKEAGDTTPQDEDAEAHVKKGPKPVTRPRLERRGKKYQAAAKKLNKDESYALADAMKLATETATTSFDSSVEIHVRLGVDPRQADQNIRSTVSLPHGTGKKVRVAVFAPEGDHAAAKSAGADVVGDDDFIKQLEKEVLDFDVLVATPQYMPKLGKFARLLGPRGLMPNPKAGTVATDVAKAVTEAKAGKVEYRVDKQAIVHLSIGKVSFGTDKLTENATVFFDSLNAQKPSSIKTVYIKSITATTTMGPGIKIAL